MGTFADDLRENRRGRFVLPYQEGWRPEHWNNYLRRCSDEQTVDDRDRQIADLGFEIGIRCQRIWEDIRSQEQAVPLAAMCSALIAHINEQFVRQETAATRSIIPNAFIGRVNAQFTKQRKQHIAEAKPVLNFGSELGAEQLADLISDYVFSRSKSGFNLSSGLDLPHITQSVHSRAAGLAELLHMIAYFQFIFDQSLFLDSIVTIEENLITSRIPTEGLSETYFIQLKLSNVAECLIEREIEERRTLAYLPLEYGDYRVVSRVRSRKARVNDVNSTVDLVYIPHAAAKSALLFLRRVVEAEYLFETLESVAGGRDIYRAWDVLHSLSKAVLENAIELENSSIFSSMIARADLTSLITQALGVSLSRARRVIDFFTFQNASRDGIWSRPIVKMDRTFDSLAHISILETNRIRALHHMISNSNLNALRGQIFQQKCIKLLSSSTLKGVVELVDFSNPTYRLLKIKKLETDFLLRLGDLLLICEAKSTSHIATPREFYHGFNALKTGADQLKKRLRTLISCRSQVEKWLFGKSVTSLDFIPVIVTNTHFFQGFSIEGVHVVCLATLIRYLRHDVNLSCADTAYYNKEGIEELFSYSIGGQKIRESIEIRKGFMLFGAYEQFLQFDYLALPEEGFSLSISGPEFCGRKAATSEIAPVNVERAVAAFKATLGLYWGSDM